MEWKGSGPKRKWILKRDEMMYIPMLETLECLLQSDTVRDQVHTCPHSNENTINMSLIHYHHVNSQVKNAVHPVFP